MEINERLTDIYRTMNLIRKFEESAYDLFGRNLLRGSVHLYVGQEAIAASVCAQLHDDDYITSTHRGHGHCLAKGADPRLAMAELMGKETGYCKGRGGSMHIADLMRGNLGANAIVGGGIPIATGAGLSIRMRGTRQVAVSFSATASNQGVFHESLNLASLWKLPVVYVCENNGFGISVPVRESTSVRDISTRAAAYDMPGETVDGNDVLAVYEAAERAIARARAGEGPTLIECKTYRWFGHWTGDPQVYRTREEVEAWKEKWVGGMAHSYDVMADADTLDELEAEAAARAAEAVEFAMNSPEPDPARVLDDVFYTEGSSL
jgi:pyruvate dehydrogenase E1 component alpha subunit